MIEDPVAEGRARANAVLKGAFMWLHDCHVCGVAGLSSSEPVRCHPEALIWKSDTPPPAREHRMEGRGKKRACVLCKRPPKSGDHCHGRPILTHGEVDALIVKAKERAKAEEALAEARERARQAESRAALKARKQAQKLGLEEGPGDVFDGH